MKHLLALVTILLSTTPLNAGETAPADLPDLPAELRLPPGFRMELVYRVPHATQGSWVCLALDGAGGFYTSDQHGKLYHVQPSAIGRAASETKVAALPVDIGMAQGLLLHRGRLYVMVNSSKPKTPSGLYAIDDTNGDNVPDKPTLLRKLDGGGEHGEHAIVAAPDGESLFVCCGNMTAPTEFQASRVPRVWQEDVVLPRIGNPPGMFRELKAPAGWIAKVDLTGQHWELFAIGFRNEYDLAFDHHGELFTFDSDMEYDIGTPWYRPTRICHVTSGAEFGWRYGSGVWPPRFEDSVPPAVEIGPGSPTGLTLGYGATFPAKYQQALFAADWSHGRIFCVTLHPDGGTYSGEWESFASAAPLPTTDLIVNPADGALYLTTGGRDIDSALYRIYFPEDQDDPLEQAIKIDHGFELRKSLEQLHDTPLPSWERVEQQAWPEIGNPDRAVRFAARTAVELQPVEKWRELALTEPALGRQLVALLALARCGTAADRATVVSRLGALPWKELTEQQQTQAIRVLAICLARGGDRPAIDRVVDEWGPPAPGSSPGLVGDLFAVASQANHERFAVVAVKVLEQTKVFADRLPRAHALSACQVGWSPDLRQRYFTVLCDMLAESRGRALSGYVDQIYDMAVENLSPAEQEQLAPLLDKAEEIRRSTARKVVARPLVKQYTLPEVEQLAAAPNLKPDAAVGRRLFHEARCAECHRLGDTGAAVGPDLTTIGRRFSLHDLAQTLVDPNFTISDQYQQTEFVVDGVKYVGRITDLVRDEIKISTDISDPKSQVEFRREDVEEQRPSKVSPMPAGLLNTLTAEEVGQLMAFLRAK